MNKKSFEVALSAVSSALTLVFLMLGAFVPMLDVTCYMLASIALMLPLTKQFYTGGVLAFISSGLLGFFFCGGNIAFIMPFAVFFGLHPLVNSLQIKFKINKIVALLIKIIWFDITLLLMYKFTEIFIVDSEFAKLLVKYIYIAIPVLGSAFFVFYDWFICRAQMVLNALVFKWKK